jgi:hypothetical protein
MVRAVLFVPFLLNSPCQSEMKKRPPPMTLFVLAGNLLLAIPLLAQAGGTIMGKVTFSGRVPPPKEFVFSKFPNAEFFKKNLKKSKDGQTRLLTEVKVTVEGGLINSFVSLRDMKEKNWLKNKRLVSLCQSLPKRLAQACAGVPRTEVVMDLCEFYPYTGVVVNRGRFFVENHDADPDDPKSAKGVLHNPHGHDVLGARSSTLFNMPLPKKGDSMSERVKMRMAWEGSVMRLQCDQHEFMQAWFLPVDNPHYAKVNEDGTYEIKNVPAGKQKILAWHPVAGKVEAEVEVPEGGTVETNFDIKGK